MKMTLLVNIALCKKTQRYFPLILLILFPAIMQAGVTGNPRDGYAPADVTLSGKVIDQTTGNGMAGVTIKIKGSERGATTDESGQFTIVAPSDATLIFTSVGYQPLEVKVKGKHDLVISMAPSSKSLGDVVVIGYGVQKKALTTAAVSTVNPDDFAQKPVVNLTNDLIGRASGLIITQGSGEPGFDGSSILIRGIGSIGSTQPLFIVDGVPRDFSRLDPNTIATLTVLKDGAAVAPYGVAGANGVILITTKQGKSGKPILDYNAYAGIMNPTRVPTFVNSYQYALMRNEANANDGNPPVYTARDIELFQNHTDPDGHSDGHPLQQIIQPNRIISYNNLSLSGGTEDVKYFASVGYTTQQGMWSTSHLQKYNGSLNVTAKATKTTTVGVSANSYVEDQYFPSVGSGSIIDQAMRQAPTTPIYYTNGLWSGYIGQSLIGEIYHSGYQLNENTTLYSQLYIEQKLPVRGLSIKGVVSYDSGPDALFGGNQTAVQRIWHTPIPLWNVDTTTHPYTYLEGNQGNSKASFQENFSQNHTLTYQGMMNYSGSFGKSDVTGLAVVEYRDVKYETFSAERINYNLNIDELNYGGPAASDETNSGYSSGEKQLGYVYRVDYDYDKKYLLQAAGRYDGSYLFAPGHRFGFFPAFSAGWRISQEEFLKNLRWLDNLKIRGSWAESGAFPSSGGNIQTYQYLSPYNAYGNSAVLGGSATQGIYEALQGNPDITWEKSKKIDLGMEGSVLKGLFGFEVDYFRDKRSNMLVSIGNALPAEYGIGTGLVNGGIMVNRGVDLTVSSYKNFSNGVRLDVKGTFTFARNKLLQVYENSATYDNPNRRQTGRPNGTQFGLQAIGYYKASDFNSSGALNQGLPTPTFGPVQVGDIKYADLNHDGKIDDNDITHIGHPNTPEIIYGLEPRLTYKNFSLDVLFQGSENSSIFVNNYFVWPFQSSGSATELAYKDHWTPTHTNALYPRLSGTPTTNNTQESSWWIRNTAYIRMKSAELGYTFSPKLLHGTIRSLRLYVAGQNIFTWTPWMKEQTDPENSGSGENYFQQRVLSVGINASF
jgi:TonB-linked SusC/RagA family outer membrane protein